MRNTEPKQNVQVWSKIVGPVFQGAWPLDIELQSSAATSRLVQMLLGTGGAFKDAASAIIPFIRSGNQRQHSSIYSISEASEETLCNSARKDAEFAQRRSWKCARWQFVRTY
jgi:hypothetical protein